MTQSKETRCPSKLDSWRLSLLASYNCFISGCDGKKEAATGTSSRWENLGSRIPDSLVLLLNSLLKERLTIKSQNPKSNMQGTTATESSPRLSDPVLVQSSPSAHFVRFSVGPCDPVFPAIPSLRSDEATACQDATRTCEARLRHPLRHPRRSEDTFRSCSPFGAPSPAFGVSPLDLNGSTTMPWLDLLACLLARRSCGRIPDKGKK